MGYNIVNNNIFMQKGLRQSILAGCGKNMFSQAAQKCPDARHPKS
jgi:hypothetical protein